ncbi:MAG: hypothetical protein ACQETD_00105 [Pseudomonadota bacterium]
MTINGAMNSALTGVRRGMEGLERNAGDVARANGRSDADVAQPLVESIVNRRQVETNVDMLKTVDETLGSLLDVKA